jgi:broad specificity phosphatase PhoE
LIKIYIARHGETIWNVEGRIQGRSDPDLSPKGYGQSLALLEQLKDRPISAIYTSTLQRSILTAQPIAQYLNRPLQKHLELDEIAFGILEGKQFLNLDEEIRSEWEKFKKDRYAYHLPQAENYTDVTNRVRPFLEKILHLHQEEEILIVGHRVVNQMMMGVLLELPPEKILKVQQGNDCLYLIHRNGDTKVFHYINGETGEGLLIESQARNF